jgi:HlyD family secretion protein
MKRAWLLAGIALPLIAVVNVFVLGRGAQPQAAGPDPARERVPQMAAGPGLVEPPSEAIRVSAQVSGTLTSVTVRDGDRVTAGQVLATVESADTVARVASARAQLAVRQAERQRIINGARPQERLEAAAAVAEADAVLQHATGEQERRQRLWREGIVSHAETDDADRAARVAQARLAAARQRAALIEATARDEDHARADADVSLATAQLTEAEALYEKTVIRAPISGIVLRRHRQTGETVSTAFDPLIVTLADDAGRRVRVDVDEADVGKVAIDMPAYVTADAFGDRRFPGRVIQVSQILGRKNIRTDEPTERVDTKILETVVELEDGRELPFGLRVQAFIVGR